MNDQVAWEQAVTKASEWYVNLKPGSKTELDGLLEEIMQLKEKLVEQVTSTGSATTCRTCGGECCLLGKYHVSMLDILAYRKSGIEPVIPDFSIYPACPYSNFSGCLMPPRYRPVTCVIFNCQLIEDHLTAVEREILYEYENKLRAAVAGATCMHDSRLDRPLLLSCG